MQRLLMNINEIQMHSSDLNEIKRKNFDGGLIPFSGGIDSAGVLYHCLTNFPEKHFLVMKVCLYNSISANRMTKEKEAVNSIINYLKEIGIRNFEYRELEYHYPSLGVPPLWDSEAVYFAAATCIRAYPEIDCLYEGVTADDYVGEGDDFNERLEKYASILHLIADRNSDNFSIKMPLNKMSKLEIMQMLPAEMLNKTWSCRYPVPKETYSYTLERCHFCPPCKVIDKAIEQDSKLIII
jgi:7-cyano-7-deazaguanine synthase in queuosine biosynthesis